MITADGVCELALDFLYISGLPSDGQDSGSRGGFVQRVRTSVPSGYLHFADVNGDGKEDLICHLHGTGEIKVRLMDASNPTGVVIETI